MDWPANRPVNRPPKSARPRPLSDLLTNSRCTRHRRIRCPCGLRQWFDTLSLPRLAPKFTPRHRPAHLFRTYCALSHTFSSVGQSPDSNISSRSKLATWQYRGHGHIVHRFPPTCRKPHFLFGRLAIYRRDRYCTAHARRRRSRRHRARFFISQPPHGCSRTKPRTGHCDRPFWLVPGTGPTIACRGLSIGYLAD